MKALVTLRSRAGQFIPITAMIVFTTVVFLVAVVNVYKVAQAKLKVQNLADAVALNVASQMASSLNKVADLNEWMNHMVAPIPGQLAAKAGSIPDCRNINQNLPPISCAENRTADHNLNYFVDKPSASSYAILIHTINDAQKQFISAYNNFIGAGTSSSASSSSQSSLKSILIGDIPELGDQGTSVYVWNSGAGPSAAPSAPAPGQPSSLNTSGMSELMFKVHPIMVAFKSSTPITETITSRPLGILLPAGAPNIDVGWMIPDPNQPTISVSSGRGGKTRIGAGAMVSRVIMVPPLGSIVVQAKAEAYVVDGSGIIGDLQSDPTNPSLQRPVFRPTFWVKLAGS